MERTTANTRDVKGVVFAGGRGTRLMPLTEHTSKQLLPIGGKPLAERVISQLVEAEVKDILVVIDDRHASNFLETLRDGSHLGVRSLSYVWQSPEGEGLPSAIGKVKYQAAGSKIVCVCGDVLVEEGLVKPVSDFMDQAGGARLALSHVDDTAGYSPVDISDDKIVAIQAKDRSRHSSGLVDLGVYMYEPDVFTKISNLKSSERGETEIGDLNDQYIHTNTLGYTAVNGWWCDVGTSMKTYLEANSRYADK